MRPRPKGRGLIGSVSSSPTGNSDLKDGVSTVVDEDNGIKEVVLNEGESIDISPEQYHFHSNPFDGESVTFWKASGDITEIIDNIRNSKRL
ncbi:MAG: hypothetical protein KAJ24_02685 [Candidatus Aenigmarchaeota archaeon]|nr:hypothetical protein [Candidatus Aenigmarchaeota archaeon]